MWIKNHSFEILALFIMLGLIVLLCSKKNINKNEVDYLKRNTSQKIKLDKNDLDYYQAFVMSELHGFKENSNIRYHFLTYLNSSKNVNVYLGEISFSSGYLLNEYIHTGNEELLSKVFSFYEGSTFYTLEEYQFYQKLYIYNKNKSKEEKIKIYGIDIEHSLESTLYFYNYYTNSSVDKVEEILKLSFSDPILIHLQKSLTDYYNFYQTLNWQKRDLAMYHNYLFLKQTFNIDKFYSQLGAKHSYRDLLSDNFMSFTYFLSHDLTSPVKDKVLSIHIFYKDSKCLEVGKVNSETIYKKVFTRKTYKTDNLSVLKKAFNLINLQRENSPYMKELIWYNTSENNKNKVTTDYYQYIILINNSEASTPLDNSKTYSPLEILIKYLTD